MPLIVLPKTSFRLLSEVDKNLVRRQRFTGKLSDTKRISKCLPFLESVSPSEVNLSIQNIGTQLLVLNLSINLSSRISFQVILENTEIPKSLLREEIQDKRLLKIIQNNDGIIAARVHDCRCTGLSSLNTNPSEEIVPALMEAVLIPSNLSGFYNQLFSHNRGLTSQSLIL